MLNENKAAPSSLAEIDERIAWILDHPDMSGWLKSALKTALSQEPLGLRNDLQILVGLIVSREAALSREAVQDRSSCF